MHKNHALRRIGVSAFLTTHIEWVAMLCGVYGLLFLFFSMDRLAWNPWLACSCRRDYRICALAREPIGKSPADPCLAGRGAAAAGFACLAK